VPLSAVPVQASERKMRSAYLALIAAFADLPLSTAARFELAELLRDRNEFDQAIKLFREAIDKEPPPELTEKIHPALGATLAAKGNPKAALTQFRAVNRNLKGPLAGQIEYRVAECLLQMGDPPPVHDGLRGFLLDRPDQVAIEQDRVTPAPTCHALAVGPGDGAVADAGNDGVADPLAEDDLAVTETGSPVRSEQQAVAVIVGHWYCLLCGSMNSRMGQGKQKGGKCWMR